MKINNFVIFFVFFFVAEEVSSISPFNNMTQIFF